MMTNAQVRADLSEAQENPVYTLYLTRREALAVWQALDGSSGSDSAGIRAMCRLTDLLNQEQPDS